MGEKNEKGEQTLLAIDMFAAKDISRGEDITSFYGPLPAITAFMQYGMVQEGATDVVSYIGLPANSYALEEK